MDSTTIAGTGSTLLPPSSTTALPNSTDLFTLAPETVRKNFYIGLALAISSNIFIGSSFIFTKLGLRNLANKEGGVRAGEGGHAYLKEWKWWVGLLMMVLGEAVNFVAYAFAPATLVTPLGALSVIASAFLASYFLKEGLNLLGKVGCVLCILGSTVMVIHSPKSAAIQDMDQLLEMCKQPGILVLFGILVLSAASFIIFLAPRYGQTNVTVYIFICASLGSLTVMGCKGLGVALTETFSGRNELTNWLTYVMLAVVIVNILFQLNYLNKALDTFNTAIVTPTYYVMFSSLVTLNSLVLFKEFNNMSVLDIIGDLCGFLTIISGIFLLNAFKYMDITYKNLPKAKKKDTEVRVLYSEGTSFKKVHHDSSNLLEFNENCSIDSDLDILCDDNIMYKMDNDDLIDDDHVTFSHKSHCNGQVTHF